MNNFSETSYRERWLTPLLQAAIQDHPIVVLTGARQVGKSTLLMNAEPFRGWRFRTLDDFDTLEQAHSNPESLWSGVNQVVLDEVQKAPNLLPAIKRTVDQHPGKYQFVLSGSANLLQMKRVSESLAGRAVYFVLDPMSMGEMNNRPHPDLLARLLRGEFPEEGEIPSALSDPAEMILRGFMPPLLTLNSSQAWVRWWEGYVATYLERDLRQVAQIDALLDFRRVMELAALRSAQLLNQSELARDARLSQPTTHRYLNILETTHLFNRLPAFTASRTTRLLKSPKVFFNDPALAVFLSGYYEVDDLLKAREYGAYFETFIYHHLRILARLMTPAGRLHFWRTMDGTEVDFVLEHGRRLLAIEVKLTGTIGYKDTAGLRAFLTDHPHASGGLILYSGARVKRLDENILAVPWSSITG
ncbi:MAG: ATP-binding protein [Chloroflexota bacterium]